MGRFLHTEFRQNMIGILAALALAAGSAGCESTGDATGTDTVTDGMPDTTVADALDVAPDSTVPDADPDATTDDVSPDVATDALPDAPPDATLDADPDVPVVGPPPRESSVFDARGSVGQIHIRGAIPGTIVQIVDADGILVTEGAADELGAKVFWTVPAGKGYTVRPKSDPGDYTGPIEVWTIDNSLPPDSFYEDQTLQEGFGYIGTRDGTRLSYFLTLPGPPEEGPYPTVLSYSGYSPSRPGRVLDEQVTGFCPDFPILCNAPDDPSNMIAALMGFATLGVNIRGTGCSDGAYDYFEPMQSLDGYDVVEILARQPWVLDHKVGMVGLSFPGIGQLFVAATRPPHLGAIAPQSVLADSLSSVLMPGGIYNDGFAKSWHDMVLDGAHPSAPGWVKDVIAAGDTVCQSHQRMHGQLRDAIEENLEHPFYTDDVAKPRDPSAWIDRIQVPVFLTGQWQDEQTGPHGMALLNGFTGAPDLRAVVTNGPHNDGFAPERLAEWMDFIQLFVAHQVPNVPDDFQALGSIFMQQVFGSMLPIGQSHLADQPDYASALAAWRAQPAIRVLFETGASPDNPPGSPMSAWEASFDAWPVPETVADRWHFQPGGGLASAVPPADGAPGTWTFDPDAGQRTIPGNVYAVPQNWQYAPLVDGKAAAFMTEPLAADRVFVGHASADLWIRVDAPEMDLEVNLTEVRADGKESYVQSGWLRGGYRVLRDDATELRPTHTFREADFAPLTPGQWTLVRVEMMPLGHAFRAGSRIRVSVDTPGDSRASWRFRLTTFATPPVIEVGNDAQHPSSIVLPWIPGVAVPADQPPCESLRNQPCRDYVPLADAE
jgi:predicted acyl esterase